VWAIERLEADEDLAGRHLRRRDGQVGEVLGQPRRGGTVRLLGARPIVEDADRRRGVSRGAKSRGGS
jgi:hypothetical protein